MTEDSLEAIDLSPHSLNRIEWNPVPSFYKIWFIHFYFLAADNGHDFPNQISHRLKFRHGFQTWMKFLSKDFLFSPDLVAEKIGRKILEVEKFWLVTYFDAFFIFETLRHFLDRKLNPEPKNYLSLSMCHLAANHMVSKWHLWITVSSRLSVILHLAILAQIWGAYPIRILQYWIVQEHFVYLLVYILSLEFCCGHREAVDPKNLRHLSLEPKHRRNRGTVYPFFKGSFARGFFNQEVHPQNFLQFLYRPKLFLAI
jgi:hypothetical protein